MKKSTLFTAFISLSFFSYAQVPDYYNNVNLELTGQSLLNELSEKITDTHTTFLSYTPGVWEACQAADVNPNNSSEVLLIYGFNDSDSEINNDRTRGINDNGGDTDDWNREHVFPRSLANPDLGTTGAGADAHNLRPCDPARNSSRSNRKFTDGSGNSGITSSGLWYPGDEWKGDVARMIMFMYLRYGDRCLPVSVGDGNIVSSDTNMVDLFLDWNAEDPVSSFEQQRNEALANIQGNRNPFIDNPAFATSIWGGTQAEDLFGTGTPSPGGNNASLIISEYVEGSSFNKVIEIANTSGSTVNLSSYSLKKQTNGAGSWSSAALNLSGTLSPNDVYIVANSAASSTVTAIADLTTTSSVMTFNGNDPVGLFFNGTLIDIVGTFNGGSSNFGANETLVRDTNISPTTTYNSSQWTSYSSNTFDFLGAYSNSGGGSNSSVRATLNITFDNYPGETSWEILSSSNTRMFSGSNYGNFSNGSSTSIDIDLNADCYTLNFYDSYGDGICCSQGNGAYSITSNGRTMASGGSFGSADSSSFCVGSTSAKTLASDASVIEEIANTTIGLTVYPNPTTNYVHITGTEIKNATYVIYNLTGAEIKKDSIINHAIDLSDLNTGQYIISIDNGTQVYTKYISKQ